MDNIGETLGAIAILIGAIACILQIILTQ